MKKKPEWWKDFFDSFRPTFDNIPPKISNAQVRFMIKHLSLKPGMSFLDCPCGIGRISIPLAKKGIKVTAVDFHKPFIDELKAKAAKKKLSIETIRADMRKVNFKNKFDVAGNIWTSFGFFENESDDLQTLKRLFEALKPGGRVFLHLINRDYIVSDFIPHLWFRTGDIYVVQENKFDFTRSRIQGTWNYIKGDERYSKELSLRIYSFHELVAMFRKIGFVDIVGYGSIKAEPITKESRMLHVIGTKPE